MSGLQKAGSFLFLRMSFMCSSQFSSAYWLSSVLTTSRLAFSKITINRFALFLAPLNSLSDRFSLFRPSPIRFIERQSIRDERPSADGMDVKKKLIKAHRLERRIVNIQSKSIRVYQIKAGRSGKSGQALLITPWRTESTASLIAFPSLATLTKCR